ncbi:MAG TPA: hypothetical protein K8V16_04925 [Rubneribacter badeniensis]|uniref:Polymerase n=1 Tax=Rubneribacter badeniensis TaxID=2070688 RepID=A0A9D2VKE4_9ACTN|nr:hypothetical protein [Rubneribacter badeniensis]
MHLNTRLLDIGSRSSWLFYVAYTLLIVGSFVSSLAVGFSGINAIYALAVALTLPRLFSVRASHVAILITLFAIPALCACFLLARDPMIVVFAVLLLAAKDLEFDSIVKHSLYIVGGMLALSLVFALLGVIPDMVLVRELHGRLVECHSLGFYHYSKVPTYWFYLYLSYSYLNRNTYSLLKHVLWLLGGLAVYLICFERLRFYLLVVAFIIFAIAGMMKNRRLSHSWRCASMAIYPVLFIISVVVAMAYTPTSGFFEEINTLLSGRLRLENVALNQFGISILGQSVEMNNSLGLTDSTQYMFVDAAYIYIPIVYGAVIGSALLLIYTLAIRKAAKNDCLVLVLAFACIAIDCLVGNQLLSIWLCPLPFYLTCSAAENVSPVSSVNKPEIMGNAIDNPMIR